VSECAPRRLSPLRIVGRWRTPTLLVFPDEEDWASQPKNARVFYDVVLGWLDEHIGPAANVSRRR